MSVGILFIDVFALKMKFIACVPGSVRIQCHQFLGIYRASPLFNVIYVGLVNSKPGYKI